MQAVDLKDVLKPYSKGWVAIDDKSKKVVAYAETFESVSKKVRGIKNVLLLPASKNYFGFVTTIHA